jgi:CheY-like chemotaxis protein
MKRALIVEDNPYMASAMADMVRLFGWETQVVSNPTAAMHAVRREAPALVLLDMNLPCIDGLDVLSFIKREPAAKDTAVVVVSAEDNPTLIERARREGARDYFVKPVDVDGLKRLLDSLPG